MLLVELCRSPFGAMRDYAGDVPPLPFEAGSCGHAAAAFQVVEPFFGRGTSMRGQKKGEPSCAQKGLCARYFLAPGG
jgi:hypothetical protein